MKIPPMPADPDHGLRLAALDRAREGFEHEGQRISFGSLAKGIHRARAQRGPAALCLMTAAPKPGRARPYDDVVDLDSQSIVYVRFEQFRAAA
jgi:hypothetical protein